MRLRSEARILAAVVLVMGLSILSTVLALAVVYQMRQSMLDTASENLASMRAAGELESALLMQRGLVSAYLLEEGNRAWLDQLGRRKPVLERWLLRARETAHTEGERRILDRLERVYGEYDAARERVITLFDQGQDQAARALLLGQVFVRADEAHELCQEFAEANQRSVSAALERAERRTQQVTLAVAVSVAVTIAGGLILLVLLFRRVWLPLRGLAADARAYTGATAVPVRPTYEEDLSAIGESLRGLMSDVRATRSSLEQSHSRLVSSQRLATIGKLAACVAHEVRNPLTAMRLALHSIRDTEQGSAEIGRKCDLLDQEIVRLDQMVGNLLEFSKPPALKLAPQSVPALMDRTLGLARFRLRQARLRLLRDSHAGLPLVLGDGQQLQQVFLNLLTNAIEAMPEGGELRVAEGIELNGDGQGVVVVRIQDSGPGLPEAVRERLFEPFVTTKQEGTGLGLCIAASIMARHGGRLVLEATSERGTRFALLLPVLGAEDGQNPGRG